MIDRIRQVGHLCRPFGVATENINIIKCINTNVNNESILWLSYKTAMFRHILGAVNLENKKFEGQLILYFA